MKKYEEVISMILAASDFKLRLNSHKGNIEELSMDMICDLAIEEIEELRKATNGEEGIIEASDAFNFLIAAAFKSVATYRSRK